MLGCFNRLPSTRGSAIKRVAPGVSHVQLSINRRRVKSSREVSALELCAGKRLRRVVPGSSNPREQNSDFLGV